VTKGRSLADARYADASAAPGIPVRIDPRYHDAALFDLDGIVTDTASLHATAWAALFDRYLKALPARDGEDHSAFTDDDYRRFVDGKPRGDGIRDFLASRGITLPQGRNCDDSDDTLCGLGNRKQRLFRDLLAGGVTAFESTVALVRQLKEVGIATAVYSSSRNCEEVLHAAGIDDLLGVHVDGVDSARMGLAGKPDPAMLIEAARRLDVRPDRCVVIEDAASGVAAARNGGFVLVVGVARTGHPSELFASGADVVITDLAEIAVRAGDRRMSSLPDALASYSLLGGVITARQPAVFLDFDGTLSDIVSDPGKATLVAGAAAALHALAAVCPVAVISGRDLDDVRPRIGVDGVWYAGSHGFELFAPDGTHHQNPAAAEARPLLKRAAATLCGDLGDIPGLLVEPKRFAVAVQYRNVAPEHVRRVAATVQSVGRQSNLLVTHGRRVIELRPNVDWNKGKALNWIVDRITVSTPLLPIYLGDDLTDEDAFDAVEHDGIGIIVRHNDDGDRPTAAHFALDDAAQVTELIARLAAQMTAARQIQDDPWSVAFEDYQPDQERLREVLCTVGNGYLATRGCAPEARAGVSHYPGTYAAGVYNRLTDTVSGGVVQNESMVNLPNWLPLTFRIDSGEWFDIDAAQLLSYRQTMNLRHAELTREMRFRDTAGRTTAVTQRRFVSMHDSHVCALKTTAIAEDWSGTIEFRSTIDGAVSNSGVERYRGLSGEHLTAIRASEVAASSVMMDVQTVQSRIPIAVATRTTVSRGDQPLAADYRYFDEGACAGHDIAVEMTSGQSVVVEKAAVIFTGRDRAMSEPAENAQRRLSRLGRYAELCEDHRTAWAQLWESFNLHLPDEADMLRIIRLHVLHVLQSVSAQTADLDAGVPARGLHGEAYRGHIFWDELFIIPVLNLRLPDVTRALLKYRYRRLPEARRAAAEGGYAGAMYPWQSGSDGREESQQLHLNPLSGRWNPDASARAHHIGIAVAYNVWQYYQATGDVQYLIDYGAEILIEIARFWVSRASLDDKLGRYVIRGVIGPDEFHSGYPGRPYDGIDNNAYTNVMAVWVIVRALEALKRLPLRERLDLLETLRLRGPELTLWDTVSRRMFVPFLDGVISQFAGYEKLLELDWDGYRKRYGNIRRLDRILEAEDDSVDNYKASKQADALMLFYLLSADELRELFARLGYRFTPDQIPKTIDYYLNRTSHGSTLSAVVHSWVLARGNRDQAMSYFKQVLKSDIADIQGGTTSEGIHLAAMAGSIDLLQRCYSGLEIRGDRLVLGPMWPEAAGVLGFSIWYRGHRLHLRITGRAADVSADPTGAPAIEVECRGRIQRLESGTTIHVC
jgi:alpha,alpha-trehalase